MVACQLNEFLRQENFVQLEIVGSDLLKAHFVKCNNTFRYLALGHPIRPCISFGSSLVAVYYRLRHYADSYTCSD